MKKFVVAKHSNIDKSFEIKTPKGMEIYIEVDFDDVWHTKVNKEARAIVKVLNNHLNYLKELCR